MLAASLLVVSLLELLRDFSTGLGGCLAEVVAVGGAKEPLVVGLGVPVYHSPEACLCTTYGSTVESKGNVDTQQGRVQRCCTC